PGLRALDGGAAVGRLCRREAASGRVLAHPCGGAPPAPEEPRELRGLPRFRYRRRRLVLALWIATVVGITAASGASGAGFSEEFRIACTDSQAAFDLLDEAGLGEALVNGSIVVRTDAGLDDPDVRRRLD